MKIDKDKFLFMYEAEAFKPLNDHQRGGLLDLLGYIEADEEVTDLRWAAYMLATTFHECAGRWQPIEEFDKGKGRKYGDPHTNGKIYYGRGFVQLTWEGNYKTIGKILGVPLYDNPELALDPEIAYKIMSYGMRHGAFTGAYLKQRIHDDVCDYIGSRRIINGTDKAELIAGYAEKFERILTECVEQETSIA